MISDLPEELVEEILSRVSIISLGAVRSTCKRWNDLSKDRVLCKAEARQQFCGFMIKGSKVCSMRFDLHGIQNNDVEVVEPSITQIDKFNQVEMLQVFHCNGLLLLVMRSTMGINSRLAVWNPYLGKMWSIQPRNTYDCFDLYTLGYDNNRNHKILREEQLAVLSYNWEAFEMEIWVTTKIEPNAVLWSSFLTVIGSSVRISAGSFFIEQEKKLAVVFDKKGCIDNVIAYIIGETGYLRTVDLGVAIVPYRHLPVYSYAPRQTRWIQPRTNYELLDKYAFGYDHNRNHKILRIMDDYEIYDFKSDSWRVLDDIHYWEVMFPQHSVSLKGNTYLFGRGEDIDEELLVITKDEEFLICFDFTRERFGPRFPLPLNFLFSNIAALSSIREEHLAVLFKPLYSSEVEIRVTTKVEPNEVLWSNFLTFDSTYSKYKILAGSFFIDQEKKLAVLFDISILKDSLRNVAHIVGENGYLRKVDLGEADVSHGHTLVCSYAPSLVQINEGLVVELSPYHSLFHSILFVSLIIFFSFIYSVLY
ncbi:F-box associated interaction domain [Arabidopsis suecica]|uniref:F-box associated interaction domain n=1 Tax=Arabidopsis suecica TaxID=45249 RepID=A0A8T2BUB9_ARASU|nr:F-box associated interaction domain [Arabidopsis suecica]